jgi:4-hydroxybenzoate polyprenyltransferase
MKQHHLAAGIGVCCLIGAALIKGDPEWTGWWMVGGMLFFALSFVIYITRR